MKCGRTDTVAHLVELFGRDVGLHLGSALPAGRQKIRQRTMFLSGLSTAFASAKRTTSCVTTTAHKLFLKTASIQLASNERYERARLGVERKVGGPFWLMVACLSGHLFVSPCAWPYTYQRTNDLP